MNTIAKGLVGTVAAGAMAVAAASPASARGYDRHHDGISAGDVIAGALVIGGIAAIASAANSDHDRYGYDDVRYNRRGYNDWYDGDGYRADPRQAAEMCVNAATRQASRYSYGGRARVTDIRGVNRNRDGFTVRGRIAVDTRGRDWRYGDGNYGRGWDGDYRGWNASVRGYDSGNFKCQIRYGRVVNVDFSGIRGL